MTALAAIGGLVIGGGLGFMLAAVLSSSGRDDSFRAGYSAGRAQSSTIGGSSISYLAQEPNDFVSYGGTE